ncbi:hypothetical protein HY523_00700 [Candidatus Berkelbacteria bacterium]|nr:hypothetical protein [Candidatus Berkelbacteria bacterium]
MKRRDRTLLLLFGLLILFPLILGGSFWLLWGPPRKPLLGSAQERERRIVSILDLAAGRFPQAAADQLRSSYSFFAEDFYSEFAQQRTTWDHSIAERLPIGATRVSEWYHRQTGNWEGGHEAEFQAEWVATLTQMTPKRVADALHKALGQTGKPTYVGELAVLCYLRTAYGPPQTPDWLENETPVLGTIFCREVMVELVRVRPSLKGEFLAWWQKRVQNTKSNYWPNQIDADIRDIPALVKQL